MSQPGQPGAAGKSKHRWHQPWVCMEGALGGKSLVAVTAAVSDLLLDGFIVMGALEEAGEGMKRGELFNAVRKMLWKQTCLIPELVCGCMFAWECAGRRMLPALSFQYDAFYFHSQRLWKLVLGFRLPEWPWHDLRPPHTISLHQKNIQFLAYNPWFDTLVPAQSWSYKVVVSGWIGTGMLGWSHCDGGHCLDRSMEQKFMYKWLTHHGIA